MKDVNELAVRIYLAKLSGFWANPDSRCELQQPSFTQCLEDAHFAQEAIAEDKRIQELLLKRSNGPRIVDRQEDRPA
jgi:hypothetical protein